MADLVAGAIAGRRHLVVQAGTGTGKTLAYLVPALAADARVVVATATKALQDQLATKDLPFLADAGVAGTTVCAGRSSRAATTTSACSGSGRSKAAPRASSSWRAWRRRRAPRSSAWPRWAGESETGDMAELDWAPSDQAWRSVSVGSDECPGAERCPSGEICFAELARRRATEADVVVVNTHLYGLHVGSGGVILPPHDVVVFDEAHVLEDVMSDTVGGQLAPGPLRHAGRDGPADPRRPPVAGGDRRAGRHAASGARPARRSTPPGPVPRPAAGGAGRGPDHARSRRRRPQPHRHPGRGRPPAQAAGPARARPGDRAARPRPRRARGHRRLRVRERRPTPAGDRPARRRPDPRRGRVGRAHGRADERHDPLVAAGSGRAAAGPGRRGRRRQPVRLRSTTPSSTARCTCPTPATPATGTPCTTSWSPSSTPPAGARWPCSRAGRRWTSPPRPCGRASTCRS